MNFEHAKKENLIKIIAINKARAINLTKTALDSIDIIKNIPLNEKSAKMITRDLYECLRQCSEAKGYELGIGFENHEVIQYFIEEILKLPKIAKEFDRYRKLRNGINYYGNQVSIETAKDAIENIPTFLKAIITSKPKPI